MKLRKVSVAAAAALALVGTATACSNDSGDKLKVGIKIDQPGMGQKTPNGEFAGFDVDVARYIAKELGYDEKDIEFVETKSADRENALKNGDVKFIVATYSITPEREEKVDFAGPYFLAHQDLLTRADDKITKGTDLNGKKLCSVSGSTSAQNLKEGKDGKPGIAPKARLQQYGTYSECISGLANGAIDALTTDDSILAGYAAQKQNQGKFKLSGLQLSNENYGVGVKKGDKETIDKINKAIEKMVSSGAWEKAVEKNLGAADYKNEPAPKIGEIKN
ncbi:glutamate ABC transporter substrate-binding protein [Streptomyces sp. NA04227]|uniref:glutamate ABC transporter substrate-binding protein n=1 Tax=Streptomyces sp. NA04227 TaxID=2742136 RepID=UPI001592534E|nr:glutamate ABC transporter substrate-binding protein [Streptomyces sp. NA04227]QKW09556.1 glutamate ABC transporter substrate-binding protein [Streptomyces sp. NA04227]